jgi:hypothetical protein
MRELQLSRLVPATTLARKGFYALGRNMVFTNNYVNCHTVKAYRTKSFERDCDIKNSIVKFLTDNGYERVTAHLTGHGIIVRIPK